MDQSFINRVYEGFEYERSRKNPPPDFAALPPIPCGRYTDPEFLQLEQQYLWRKSWLYACHADEVPHTGSYFLWNKTHAPILIVRDGNDRVRAFYNTCRHRGGPLVTGTSGKVNGGFICGYHGWAYDLEGNLKGVRDRRDFTDLEPDCLGLMSVRCERLGKWIFINEDPDAKPLAESLGPISQQWRQFDPDSIRHVESYGFNVECNVKVMLEAFFEVYHLQSTHPDTASRFLDHRATSIILWPTGDRTMRVDCHWFAPDWGEGERHPLWDQRIRNFNRILQQDMELVPQIQQSMESRGFTGTRLNYQERRIYHWHEELDRRIGTENIPCHLRVEPHLSEMIEQ